MNTPYRIAVRRLGLARLVSVAGSEAAFIALIAALYARTHSSLWVSGGLLATIGVRGLAGPLAGAVGDRYDRRLVMIGSDLGAAACFVGLATVHDPALLIALASIASALEAPFLPASGAAVPNLVPAHELTWANAEIAATRTFGHLLGPLAGGLLVAAVGPASAFLANALTFLVSAAIVASIRGPFAAGPRPHGQGLGLGDGFRAIRANRTLRTMTAAWAVLLLFVGVILVAERPLAGQFGVGDLGYGVLVASWGGGAIVGARLARRVIERIGEPASLVAGTAVMGVGIGVVGLSPWFGPILVAMGFGGIGNGVIDVAEQTLMQTNTRDEVRSRALAASDAVAIGSFALSFVIGGPIADLVGPQPVYTSGPLRCAIAGSRLPTLPRDRRPGPTAVAKSTA